MKILLQFPEGLKQYALEHAEKLEKEGNEVIISASPSFGACDVVIEEAKSVGAEKIVHFGHAEFMHIDVGIEVEYVPFNIDADLGVLNDTLEELKQFRRIGIVTTIQHINQLHDVKSFYEGNGKEVLIGKPYGFAKEMGQILGCDVGSATTIEKDVNCFVYFGGGLFHPLGAVYATTKPFLAVDPFERKFAWLDSYREKQKRSQRARITRALTAEKFGILVSTKIGQQNMALAELLKKKMEGSGLRAVILLASTFDFTSLENMREIDAFVNTACPRLVTDDEERLSRPLLSASELNEMLSIRAQSNRENKEKENKRKESDDFR